MTEPNQDGERRGSLLADLATVLAFLSVLPLPPAWRADPRRPLAQAARAFPLAGALLGLLAGLPLAALHNLGLAPSAAALLAVLTLVLLSGGLHEDGLADSADALAGGTPTARLAIMRDSRIGTFGALAVLFSVGLRWAALAALVPSGAVLAAAIVAGALSRSVPVVLLFWLPPARVDGLGQAAGRPAASGLLAALGLAGMFTLLLVGVLAGLAALAAAGIATLLVGRLADRGLGGQTGDILGAGQQVAECLVLLTLAVVLV
ncbi:MAG: adenosylcobinamide-GDP ribazoletransferase [Alphaproteobacteria bacterium]|nr:adenosylcobinamide-GDP ribazoletransferase [Alphaproteobacteria bacterium]